MHDIQKEAHRGQAVVHTVCVCADVPSNIVCLEDVVQIIAVKLSLLIFHLLPSHYPVFTDKEFHPSIKYFKVLIVYIPYD